MFARGRGVEESWRARSLSRSMRHNSRCNTEFSPRPPHPHLRRNRLRRKPNPECLAKKRRGPPSQKKYSPANTPPRHPFFPPQVPVPPPPLVSRGFSSRSASPTPPPAAPPPPLQSTPAISPPPTKTSLSRGSYPYFAP